jgi:hypothetical protein
MVVYDRREGNELASRGAIYVMAFVSLRDEKTLWYAAKIHEIHEKVTVAPCVLVLNTVK